MAESDEALIRAYGAGRRDALGPLVERRFAGAYRVALRALGDPGAAEDAACEAFAAVTREARRFEAGRAFGPWFAAILANAIRKQERSRQRRTRHEARAAVRPVAPDVDRDGPLDAERVGVALQALPLDLRLPLALHFQDGRTHAEVAAALGCPVGTASSRIRRGLEELRATLVGAAGALAPGALEEALAAAPAGRVAAPSLARLEALGRGGRRGSLASVVSVALVLLLAAAAGAAWLAATAPAAPEPPLAPPPAVAPPAPVATPGPPAPPAAPAAAEAPVGSGEAPGATTTEAPDEAGSVEEPPAPRRVRRIVGRVVLPAEPGAVGAPVAGARVIASREADWTPADEDTDLVARARAAASTPIESRVLRFQVSRWGQRVDEVGRGRSGPDGRFELVVDVLSDRLEVGASTEAPLAVGHAALGSDRRDAPGDTLDTGDVVLYPSKRLEVRVRSQGRPLAGADVLLTVPTSDSIADDFWAHAATDADGVAWPVDPFGGAVLVVVRAPGLATAVRSIDLQERFEFDLAPGVTTTVRLLDPQGQPLAGVEGELRSDADRHTDWHVLVRGRSGPDGTLVLPDLAAGAPHRLSLASPRPGLLSRTVSFRPVPALTVTFGAPLEVRLVVTGPDVGEAREHVTLQRRGPDGRWEVATPGDASGGEPRLDLDEQRPPPEEGCFGGLDAGTYRAIAEAPGCATVVTPPFELVQGEPPRALTLRLGPGALARGRVLRATGAPARGIEVRLRLGDHDVSLGYTAEDGSYETRQLPAGDVDALLGAFTFVDGVTVPLPPDRATLPDLVVPAHEDE